MPQKPSKDKWQIPTEDHEYWLHKLGNITLIDRRKNSSLSNSTFEVKKEKYSNFIENRANTNYVFIKYNEWNVDSIINNHNRQINMLKKYYLGNNLQTLNEMRKSK